MLHELPLHLAGIFDDGVELLDIAASGAHRALRVFVETGNVVDNGEQGLALLSEKVKRVG